MACLSELICRHPFPLHSGAGCPWFSCWEQFEEFLIWYPQHGGHSMKGAGTGETFPRQVVIDGRSCEPTCGCKLLHTHIEYGQHTRITSFLTPCQEFPKDLSAIHFFPQNPLCR